MIDRGTAALVASMRRGPIRLTASAAPSSLARAREAGRLLGLAAAARPAGQLVGVGGILPEFTGPEAARARIRAVDAFLCGIEADMQREANGRGGALGELSKRWAPFFSGWIKFRVENSNDPYTTLQVLSSASIGNQADQYELDGKKYRAELVALGGHPSTPAPAETPIDPNVAAITGTVKWVALGVVAVVGAVMLSKARGLPRGLSPGAAWRGRRPRRRGCLPPGARA